MKHLKKFNEDVEIDDRKDYFDSCFIDFIDKGAIGYGQEFERDEEDDDIDEYKYDIVMRVPDCWFDSGHTLEKNIESSKILTEFYLDIENSIDKIKLKYPNIEIIYTTSQDGHSKEVEILFIEKLL